MNDKEFVDALEQSALNDDSAAREHLSAGRPIHIIERSTPKGWVVRQHPDGRRELVKFGKSGDQIAA